MQMKKNYLLLFLIALLFGTATMRGQSVPFDKIDATKGYIMKVGTAYLVLKDETTITTTTKKEEATLLSVNPEHNGNISSIVSKEDNGKNALGYKNQRKGKFKLAQDGTYNAFLYKQENGKYYLQATEGNANGKYLSCASGVLSLEENISANAIIELTDPNGSSDAEVTLNAKKMRETLALFQAKRKGQDHFPNGFFGTGLGQYPQPTLANNVFDYVTYNIYLEGHADIGNGNASSEMEKMKTLKNALQINLPKNGTFVVITTKSSFEDAVRDNAKVFRTKVDIDVAAGPKQSAKYLKATATGYQLTTDKAEAAVFFFDGNHLTGLDYGFGLNTTQNKYNLTETEQKAVVAQGKLEKTLDAGSYSLKVGNKFVKLDNTSGLSVTDNESDSHIFLEEATEFKLNTDALGYVSFFAPTAVELPTGVEVYTGKLNAQNSVVNLKKVNTTKIPANTAVLLRKGTTSTNFLVKKFNGTPTSLGENFLKGYTVSSNQRVANAYGFAVQGNKLVFIPLTDGVRAFKAVIFNGNAAGMQEFIPAAFVPTGIEGVTAEENKEEIFDLTGRRVESPVQGQIYVKGGKKFIQK
jgi:hypothetical protein